MNHVRVWVRVKLDETGCSVRLPVIFIVIDETVKVLKPVLEFLAKHCNDRSHSWMTKLCEIVGRLLDYIEVSNRSSMKPAKIFEGFVNALYNGTFDNSNNDPSGLCWFPSSAKTINPKLSMLEELSDWMVLSGYVLEPLNPWTEATTVEQKFN